MASKHLPVAFFVSLAMIETSVEGSPVRNALPPCPPHEHMFDDPAWEYATSDKTHHCGWVRDAPEGRCGELSVDGVEARNACRAACSSCVGACASGVGDAAWWSHRLEGDDGDVVGCDWVAEERHARCGAKSATKWHGHTVTAGEACSAACFGCVKSHVCPAGMTDSDEAWGEHTCDWVAQDPRERCAATWGDRTARDDFCRATCLGCTPLLEDPTPAPTAAPSTIGRAESRASKVAKHYKLIQVLFWGAFVTIFIIIAGACYLKVRGPTSEYKPARVLVSQHSQEFKYSDDPDETPITPYYSNVLHRAEQESKTRDPWSPGDSEGLELRTGHASFPRSAREAAGIERSPSGLV